MLARALRYVVRVPFLLLHLFVSLPVAVLFSAIPGVRDWRIGDDTLRGHAIRRWSKTLCRIFGMRVHRLGELHDDPVMLLANHVTWMDIEVIHAIRAVGFVGKAEIKAWPVIGNEYVNPDAPLVHLRRTPDRMQIDLRFGELECVFQKVADHLLKILLLPPEAGVLRALHINGNVLVEIDPLQRPGKAVQHRFHGRD